MSDRPNEQPLNTFLVRFWRETGAHGVRWRGQIRHIQSEEQVAFTDEAHLLAFLRRWIQLPGDDDDEVTSRAQEKNPTTM